MLVDFELIKRAQKGDGAAFNEVYWHIGNAFWGRSRV